MKKRTIAILISLALLVSMAIPVLNYFQEGGNNSQIVFEYKNKKVYETEVKPYVDYYSQINESFDVESKNYAVDNYIRSVILSEFAKEIGIEITDADVLTYINKSPIFQDNEKFSKIKYDAFIERIGIKPSLFENEVRKDLYIVALMEKLDGITNIQDYYFNIINETLAQKRKIEKVRVNMADIPVVYDKDLLQKKYEQNKDKYRKPDQIIFTKYTYTHNLNQSDNQDDIDLVNLETNTLYNDISKLTSDELSYKILQTERDFNLSNTSMMLDRDDFIKLLGTKNSLNLEKGTFLVDSESIDNGVLSIYEVTNISKGRQMDYSEAYYHLERDYAEDMKLDTAKKYISQINNLKDLQVSYFGKVEDEIVDPLKNDKTERFYNTVYSIPVGGLDLYFDDERNEFYFIKVNNIEKISLTDEQMKYFRTSQNNMYKQFNLLSLYDSLKKQYNFKKYKKES